MSKHTQQIYAIHPAAELFPMMGAKEFSEFREDIATHGIKEWGTLYRDQVLDGRNRYKACQELGIEMDFCELDDKDGFDPVAYVLSHNLHRRHLTTSQRSMVAENVAKLKRGDNQHKNEDSSIDLSSQQEAASLLNVSVPSVKRARIVKSKGTPELAQMVLDGKVSVDAASRVATKPTAEQETIVSQGPAAVKEAAKTVPKKVAKGTAIVPEIKSHLTGFMEFWSQCDEIGKKAIYVWLQDNYKS